MLVQVLYRLHIHINSSKIVCIPQKEKIIRLKAQEKLFFNHKHRAFVINFQFVVRFKIKI